MKDGKRGARAIAARRPGGRGSGRGARAGRDGAALGQAAVPALRRTGAEAGGARLPGVVRGWRGASPRSTAGRRQGGGPARRRFTEMFAAKPLRGGRHLAPPRSGLDAGQAARRCRTPSTRARSRRRSSTAVRAAGGVMTAEDLARYATVDRTPLETRYRGLRVASMPPPSSGGLALIETLGILAARYPAGPAAAGETRGERRAASRAGRGVQARLRRPRPLPGRHGLRHGRRGAPGQPRPITPSWRAGSSRARCCRATRTGRWGRRPRRRKDARDGAPVRDRRRRQRGRADHDRQPRLRRSPGRGQDRHRAQRRDGRLLAGAGRAQRVRPDRQRAERDRAAQAAAVVDDADDRARRGGKVRVVVGAAGGPTIITATAQVLLNVVDWQDGRAGRDRGAAHPPPVVSRDAGASSPTIGARRDRRPRASAGTRSRRSRTSGRSTCWCAPTPGIEAAAEPRSPSRPAGY